MPVNRNREEVVNTQLAICISRLGVTADAETIHVHGAHRPDVLFQLRGLRVVIEGKFADHPQAKEVVLDDARKRVRSGIAHIAAAVVYPRALRTTPTTKILSAFDKSQLTFRIVSETYESDEWYEGDAAGLMDALRRAQESLVKDDIVEETAKSLSIQLEAVSKLWRGQAGQCDRLSEILGITILDKESEEKAFERRETAAKVSALVLANALIFQEQLAATDRRVTPLRKLDNAEDLVGTVCNHWRWIWTNINYVPIFQLGERILSELPINTNSALCVKALLSEAQNICARQSALRHDLMGRIYHWLLHNAKYLGTYYTSVPSATLLLKLAIGQKWRQSFGDPAQLVDFKVADLACGTGTLLMATAQSIADAYIRIRAEEGLSLTPADLQSLHRALMENVLHGYDVLPSAVHLTASTLAMLAPEVAFVRMNLFVMPLGMNGTEPRLGSLDFLGSRKLQTQMALDYSQAEIIRTGAATSAAVNATVPKLNLCVMNPPFVRSVGGNLLFGSLPDSERATLQKELKERVTQIGASATAGLGSVFLALADQLLEEGGRIAFVLPAAIASGEAWAHSRKLIADRYHLEMVIASHDADHPNFSENTDLSEVLFIARKLKAKEHKGSTKYVSLWRNPRTIHEALDVANRIEQIDHPVSVDGEGLSTLRSAAQKLGEIITMPAPVGEELWTGALFAQADLLRTGYALERGALRLPGEPKILKLPTCRLGELGVLGYDRRDIHDAFEYSESDWSPYPAFWGHEAAKVTSVTQEPNGHMLPRKGAIKGRKLKDAKSVWSKAGRLLLVERLRSNTHRVLAVRFDRDVIGNTWWSLKTNELSTKQEKALALWLNGSLAILLFFCRRVVTEGAWMQMKKPGWESMPVLDVRSLSSGQLNDLASAFDASAEKNLQAIAALASDTARIEVDDAISRALKLPDFSAVRELLAREPGLSAIGISPRTHVPATSQPHF